ncbi:D-3-phosphoglycerate dehydrogenase [Novosphingobium kunmingense]|uniref:D-3-phosphoglycerate dehydrogenase n=1 Tax=Novosphingobium kunmingense TaxID=1211806 RepID=A0A2N0H396_9SPHN|nr:hydroxyacid dehydrogenase [Novosphingobium kunmingense]PKB13370.1 D-3-phosphoglycerate dehydrogenase [Novosphingobium kunmingense]
MLPELRPRIAIFGRALAPAAMALAEEAGAIVVTTDGYLRGDELIAFMQENNPHGIILRLGEVGADAMAAAPALRIIAKHGVGYDTIDVAAATERDILVSIATGANAISVAEQALGLMLAAGRGIAYLDSRIRSGHWDKATFLGTELCGKRLGIVGMGAIGRHLITICRGLGMSVAVFDPGLDASDLRAMGLEPALSLETILRESDVVSLHCPLTAATRNLIAKPQLELMKPRSILINTARGGLIDLKDLGQALAEGKIGGAGLDTFPVEPLDLPETLRGLPNLVVSPHVGASTVEAGERVGLTAMAQVIDHLAGRAVDDKFAVNRPGVNA